MRQQRRQRRGISNNNRLTVEVAVVVVEVVVEVVAVAVVVEAIKERTARKGTAQEIQAYQESLQLIVPNTPQRYGDT